MRSPLLAMLAASAALALTAASPALAQDPRAGVEPWSPAPGATSPEPLWVPDPEPRAIEEQLPADVPAAAVLAQAQAVALVPAAGDPSRIAVAHWLAEGATAAGLPAELPVMAALVESGLRNLPYGDRDSVGLFQMRVGIWDQGRYEGYLARPELQLRWFVDRALAVRAARIAAGQDDPAADPSTWGDWIAAIEQPAARYRGRYALRLAEAQALLAAPATTLAPFELGLTVGGPSLGADADAVADDDSASEPIAVPLIVPQAAHPRRPARAPAEPRFVAAGAAASAQQRGGDEPRFEAGR